MKNISAFAGLVCLMAITACGLSAGPLSGDPPGSSDADAGETAVTSDDDSGTQVTADGGTSNRDSGSAPAKDGGKAPIDSGSASLDGSVVDASDSGSVTDSGPPPKKDAGVVDSGTVSDAGPDAACVDAGSDSGPKVPDNADVVKLAADGKSLGLSTRYIFSANCGEVLGDMPGVGWTLGPRTCDTDSDGYFTYTPTLGTVGTYAFSYRDYTKAPDGWALYGDINLLKGMTPAAREFVQCNWWDAVGKVTVNVANPSCSLKATFASSGQLVGAGNMANLQ